MEFQDTGPIFTICRLLFVAARAFLPSSFPDARCLSDSFNSVKDALRQLDAKADDVDRNVQLSKNAAQDPDPVPRESMVELVSGVRTKLQRNTDAVLEQRNQYEHLTTVFQGLPTHEDIWDPRADVQALVKREYVMPKADQMIQLLAEMRDAFSKLPEPVSAFPKIPGNRMQHYDF